MDNWTELIDDLVAGRWVNPETQELASVPFESIVIKESLEGQEVELLNQIQWFLRNLLGLTLPPMEKRNKSRIEAMHA